MSFKHSCLSGTKSDSSRRHVESDFIRKLFESYRVFRQFLRTLSKSNLNPLRLLKIICHPRLISGLVVPAITRFAAQEPDIKVNLEVHPRRYFGQQLMHDTYDIAVSNLHLPVENLSVETLATSEIKVVLPKGHALEVHSVLTPDLVRSERYIALDETTLLRQLTDLEMAKSGKLLRPTYEVSSASAALGLVRNGLVITLTDQVMFDRDLSEQITLRHWLPLTQIRVGFCLGHNTELHPSVAAFQDCLIAVSGEHW